MAATEDHLSKATMLGMIAMGVAVLVVANDFTALSVALPAIESTLHTNVTTVQWVINGYAMVFGVLIVTGGRLADMFGRRRIFFAGAAFFAGFSLIGGFAPNVWVLLACRFLMGIGGAMMWPAILGMTYGLLPRAKAGLAGGVILGAAGFGNAVGPLLGGLLTDTVGWRWIFFVNLPVAAAAVLITLLVVAHDAPVDHHGGIDYRGTAALSLGLLALLLALDWALDLGWTAPLIIFLFVLAGVALAAFLLIERRAGDSALVPETVLQNRGFVAASIATLLASAIFFAALLYLPQFMSKSLGFSAIGSGAGLLPMMGTFMVTSFIAGRLYQLLGPKLIVTLGALLLGAGMILLSRISGNTTYDQLIFGMKTETAPRYSREAVIYVGDDLLSHTLSRAVQSALRGLTSVFGMGTGVSPAVFYGQAERAISTGKLHALLHFHIQPIKHVVFDCALLYPFGLGDLILRRASRLDAFSGYHFRLRYPAVPLA
jgi:EmrB/QacA subfamily drug resistance transporter